MNSNRLPLVTYKQARMLKHLGFNRHADFAFYDCPSRHEEQVSADLQAALEIVGNAGGDVYKRPNLYDAAKWMREAIGIDIVVSPRFESETGYRIGYFWRWSQRTDVNMGPTIQDTYEDALSNAITTILEPIGDHYWPQGTTSKNYKKRH